ncbi:MAG: hypothetical protein ACRCSX_15695 [Allorhizobium sp.]
MDEDLALRTAREMGIDLRHLIVLRARFDLDRSIVRPLNTAFGIGKAAIISVDFQE